MDPASRASYLHQGQRCRPPLPTGSPSVPSRMACHPVSARLNRLRPPFGLLDPSSLGPVAVAQHHRPHTPFPNRPDPTGEPSSSLHARSFSYDDHSLSKDKPAASSAYIDLDDIIGRSVSSRSLLDPVVKHQQTTNSPPRKQLSSAVHQRSLSVPATPDDRRPSRVHFENATSSPHQAVGFHHQQSHPAIPSSPLRVATQEVEKGRVNDAVPPSRQSGDSQERTTRTECKNQAEETQKQIDIDGLPQRTSESQLGSPITPAAVVGENDPPVNTVSTQPPSAQRDLSRPANISANTDNSAVLPSAPSPSHGRNHSQQRDQKPQSTRDSTSVPPYPAPSSSPELPPQVYPGKQSPLLPPPLPAPRPREISFPRPFRRRLSVVIEPSAVQLPPSPPAEFDFSAFENPPNLAASSSSNLYSLLDDSPYLFTFDHPSSHHFESDSPLIDLTDEEIPGQQASLQECCHSDVKKPYSHFTPLPSPVISEKPLLSSILSSPSTVYLPVRAAQDKIGGGPESQQGSSTHSNH